MWAEVIKFWRVDLAHFLQYYRSRRDESDYFFPYLFLFFIVLNGSCYWLAMLTAFPELLLGNSFWYYFKVQFPVSILGALFDSLSFFVTIFIIKRALNTQNNSVYIAHLSLDLLIAILATFWVVFVFIVSGWIVSFFDTLNQSAAIIQHYDHETNIYQRAEGYGGKVNDAIQNPTENLQNIYFGLVMGISAMLPTFVHISLFLKSLCTSFVIELKRQKF